LIQVTRPGRNQFYASQNPSLPAVTFACRNNLGFIWARIPIVSADIQTATTPQDTSGVEGNWRGALEVGGFKLRLVLKISKTDGCKPSAIGSWPIPEEDRIFNRELETLKSLVSSIRGSDLGPTASG
jgi:hypothetical protein